MFRNRRLEAIEIVLVAVLNLCNLGLLLLQLSQQFLVFALQIGNDLIRNITKLTKDLGILIGGQQTAKQSDTGRTLRSASRLGATRRHGSR